MKGALGQLRWEVEAAVSVDQYFDLWREDVPIPKTHIFSTPPHHMRLWSSVQHSRFLWISILWSTTQTYPMRGIAEEGRDCGTVQAHALQQQYTTSFPVLWLEAPDTSPLQTTVPSHVSWRMWERRQNMWKWMTEGGRSLRLPFCKNMGFILKASMSEKYFALKNKFWNCLVLCKMIV